MNKSPFLACLGAGVLTFGSGGSLLATPFTIAVIGDQQRAVDNAALYPSFTVQTDWLAANAQANNIRFVTQVGDIIEHGNDLLEWDRAEAAMVVLDSATNADSGTGIPWNVNYGNHEVNWGAPGSDPAGADADNYRQYFGSGSGTHRYAGQPEFGGVSSNDLNTWHIIKSSSAVDARQYLMLNLEYDVPGHAPGATPDPGDIPAFDAIAWAQNIIDQHPGMPTVITTHVFEGTAFGPPNNPYTPGPGRNSQLEIFDKLVKDNPQIFMVFSGHTSQETHQVKQNTAGLDVLQMVTDYTKWLGNAGDGYMRMVELDEGAGEIRVKTYTPGIPSYSPPVPAGYRTTANGEFTVSLDWATRFPVVTGPAMGAPAVNAVNDDGADAQSLLANEDADDVTLVWAFADQGETTVGDWTTAPGGGSYSFGSTLAGTTLNHVITGLSGDTVYHVRFLATAGVDEGWSQAVSFATGLGGLSAPGGFAGVPGTIPGGTKVDLSWTDGFANETGFVIRRSTDPAFGTYDEFTVGADETSYADETTAANTTYFYRIAGTGSTGAGVFSANLEVATGDAGSGSAAGLMGHWKFDEGSGTLAADSSIYGRDADRIVTAGGWAAGKNGGAYNLPRFALDGSESTALNLAGGGVVTVSAWITDRTGGSFEGIVGLEKGGGSAGDVYSLKMGNDDKINWTVLPSHGPLASADTLANYAAATTDGWVHVVGVFEQGVGSTLYVNGAVAASTGAAASPIASETTAFTIGSYDGGGFGFSGSVDDVQVYNAALSTTDVAYLGSNPGTPLGGEVSGPVMAIPSSSGATDNGVTLACQLLNADADEVTLVWALADQGETDVSTWTSAAGGGSHSFGGAVEDQVLSHALSGLAGDTEFSFRFLASAGGESDWSVAGTFATGLGGAAAPAGLAAVAGTTATATKVDLTWADSFATETGFKIQRATDAGFTAPDEFSVGANETSYTDNSTAPNTTYFYRIAAEGSSGVGTFSAGVEVTTGNNPEVAPQVVRGPYLQSAADDRMTIRWRTDIAGTGVVRYGTTLGVLNQSASPGTSETEHVVPITGLSPDTVYFYEVVTQNGTVATTVGGDADHTFKTHPTPGTSGPSRIWVIGDSGTTTAAKQDVYDAYRNRGEATDVWLMLGDNAYEHGTDAEFQAAVFDSYPELLRNTPLWSCLGNHEADTSNGQPYLDLHSFPTAGESGGVASGTERYYSFDYGDIHFVCIDSQTTGNFNDVPGGGGMVDWLELDLQATDKDWIIAYMHHGPYTKGSHDSDVENQHIVMRRYVTPLLEQYGVDLVLSGHSHCYERSMLINGHHSAMSTGDSTSGTFDPLVHVIDGGNGSAVGSVDGTGAFVADGGDGVYEKLAPSGEVGTVYSICGASGKLSPWDNGSTAVVNPAPHPVHIVNLRVMGSMIIDVDGGALHARYIDGSNVVRDDFTIQKVGTGLFLGDTSASTITDTGATAECRVYNTAADAVTLVWAYTDQGATTIGDWTSAAGGGSHSFGAALQDEVLSHAITGLAGDTAYSFRFFATAGAESHWSSATEFNTGLVGNPAPTGLAAVAGTTATATKVDLTWADPFTHETGFLIQRSADAGFSVVDEFPVAADATAFTDDTTDPNTTYHYRIAGVGSSGTGAFSSGVEVTTGNNPSGGGPVASLLGHWTFDDGTGTTAADASGNGYDAAQVNGDGGWIAGKAGGAYSQPRFTLDATESDVVNLAGGGVVTLSAWITEHSTSNFAGIVGFEGTGSTGDIYSLKMDNADRINWTVLPSHGPVASADTLANYAAATGDGWVHVVGVFKQGVGSTLYVNGAVAATGSATAPIPDKTTPGLFRIGTYYNSNSYEFNGAIDDVQLYEQALTVEEISFLFNNPGSPLLTPDPDFSDWIGGFTGLGGETGFNDDPDLDGLGNGLEAWFGTHPGVFSQGVSGIVSDGTTTTFSHPRNEAPPSGVSGTYEWSPNLSNWFSSGGGPAGGPTVTFVPVPSGSTTTVTATASEPIGRLYLRVVATNN